MRTTSRLAGFVLVLLLAAPALADTLVTHDGRVVRGTVGEVTLTTSAGKRETVARPRIASLVLAGDRVHLDLLWLTRTQRYALDRDVEAEATVAVYVGRGAFPPSAIALVRRLDARGTPPRLLFGDDIRAKNLAKVKRLFVPGGWAPSMLDAMGKEGQEALRRYVRKGGHYVGICAGAYLPVTAVRWEGVDVSYPVGLVEGVAIGPIDGLAPWPTSGHVTLTLADGKREVGALYAGGCRLDVKRAEVLARYPDGTPATIWVKAGRGHLVLTGAHVEFDPKKDRDLLEQDGWASSVRRIDRQAVELILGAETR